jgi:hypothetical protein
VCPHSPVCLSMTLQTVPKLPLPSIRRRRYFSVNAAGRASCTSGGRGSKAAGCGWEPAGRGWGGRRGVLWGDGLWADVLWGGVLCRGWHRGGVGLQGFGAHVVSGFRPETAESRKSVKIDRGVKKKKKSHYSSHIRLIRRP